MALGIVATSFALGWTVRHQMEWEAATEVAVDGTQAFIQIPTHGTGYQMSPAGMLGASLKRLLNPFAFPPYTHRSYQKTVLVIDAHGVRTMRFRGVGGPFLVTSEGPVVRIGDQFCLWNGRALVTLTPEKAVAVQRGDTGPVRGPWSKRGIVYREPSMVVSFTTDELPYQLEAHAAGRVKTLWLIDPRGRRQVLWTLDEAFHSLSAEQFEQQFH
jgi:hypothetical protein